MTAPYGILRNEALPEVESVMQRYAGIGSVRYFSAPPKLYDGEIRTDISQFSRKGKSIDDEVGLPIGRTPLSSGSFYGLPGRDRTVLYS